VYLNSFPTQFDSLEYPTSIYIENIGKTQNIFAFLSPWLYELKNTVPIIYLSIYITYQELRASGQTPGMLCYHPPPGGLPPGKIIPAGTQLKDGRGSIPMYMLSTHM